MSQSRIVTMSGQSGMPAINTPHSAEAHTLDPQQVMATRELFWQNVIREILTSLSMMSALRPSTPPATPELETGEEMLNPAASSFTELEDSAAAEPVEGEADGESEAGEEEEAQEGATDSDEAENNGSYDDQLFDGRLAIITRRGERIPIAEVFPVFACGIDTPRDRVLSLALECTVFQIRTPAGEVYTLPLHEIGSFQALSPELMRRLAQMARRQQEQESGERGLQQPFGFAAFTSIAKETPPPMTEEAEQDGPG